MYAPDTVTIEGFNQGFILYVFECLLLSLEGKRSSLHHSRTSVIQVITNCVLDLAIHLLSVAPLLALPALK